MRIGRMVSQIGFEIFMSQSLARFCFSEELLQGMPLEL